MRAHTRVTDNVSVNRSPSLGSAYYVLGTVLQGLSQALSHKLWVVTLISPFN